MAITHKRPNSLPKRVYIVGGGPAGLSIGISLVDFSRELGVPLEVQIFERDMFGGGRDDQVAATHCQAWAQHGFLYAGGQPTVTTALHYSIERLKALAPQAFAKAGKPISFAIQPPIPGADGDLASFLNVLEVWYKEVPRQVMHRWLPNVCWQPGTKAYRVEDSSFDLKLLSYGLMRQAQERDIRLVQNGVKQLVCQGEEISRLILDNDSEINVAASGGGIVILACGAGIRSLLTTAGITLSGLRHFKSQLIATDAFNLPYLISVGEPGWVNCVPQLANTPGGLINIFGAGDRVELPPDQDGKPVEVDDKVNLEIAEAIEEWLGVPLRQVLSKNGASLGSKNSKRSWGSWAWAGVKVEYVTSEAGKDFQGKVIVGGPTGTRSQSHLSCLVEPLTNCWMALPGKLSQAAGCGLDLAHKIVRELIQDPVAESIWEQKDQNAVRGSQKMEAYLPQSQVA